MHEGNILFLLVNKNNILIKSLANFAIEMYTRPDGFFTTELRHIRKL